VQLKIKNSSPGVFQIASIPVRAKGVQLHVRLHGEHISGSPIQTFVTDPEDETADIDWNAVSAKDTEMTSVTFTPQNPDEPSMAQPVNAGVSNLQPMNAGGGMNPMMQGMQPMNPMAYGSMMQMHGGMSGMPMNAMQPMMTGGGMMGGPVTMNPGMQPRGGFAGANPMLGSMMARGGANPMSTGGMNPMNTGGLQPMNSSAANDELAQLLNSLEGGGPKNLQPASSSANEELAALLAQMESSNPKSPTSARAQARNTMGATDDLADLLSQMGC